MGLKKPTINNKNILPILKILIFKAKTIIKPKINDVPETPIKGRYPVKLIGTEKIPIFSHGNPDIIQERTHSKMNIKEGTSNTKNLFPSKNFIKKVKKPK